MLFNQIISVGYEPHDWLNAVIVPVFKKGVVGKPVVITSLSN